MYAYDIETQRSRLSWGWHRLSANGKMRSSTTPNDTPKHHIKRPSTSDTQAPTTLTQNLPTAKMEGQLDIK